MTKEELIELKKQLSTLTEEEQKERDLYLRGLANGEIQGPPVGYPSIDKPWLRYYSEDAISTEIPKMTAYDYLLQCNHNHMDRPALKYFGKTITFRELFENIDATAKALKSAGIQENDIVTISLPNIPEAVYLFYACSKLGIVANMVDPRTSEAGIKKYIDEVDSKYVFIIDSYIDKVNGLIGKGTVENVVQVSPADSLPIALKIAYNVKNMFNNIKPKITGVVEWPKFLLQGKNFCGAITSEYKENRPLVIEHTGGTTGVPKGVILSNENINSVAVQSMLTGIDMKREHNWMDIMPTFIAYGVGMGLHLPLTIGMETILVPKFEAEKFDQLLLKHKPVHMVGVPSYWGTIINSPKMKKQDLSYMIAPTVGGDAMDITLEQDANRFLEEHNCTSKITKGYGMTEVTGGVSGTLDNNNQIGSVGSPFVKTTISIFDPETGEELRYGKNQIGEVCITGPNTMIGYFNNEEATRELLRVHEDNTVWVHSGDLGYITEDGSLFIVDRIKRMIIRYDGFKVFPSMIESVISQHEAVESCKVVGIKDSEHSQGKLPKAHIVLKDEFADKTEKVIEEIRTLCDDQLPDYALPVDYKVRESMPLTSVGKIDYLTLEKEDANVKTLQKK